MSDQVAGFLGAIVFLAVIICAIRGFFHFGADIDDYYTNRRKKKRNALPDTPIEKAIRAAINLMVDDPTQWETATGKMDGYGRTFEYVRRKDEKIILSNYFDGGQMDISFSGIGSFNRNDLKPEVADKLSKACQQFKQLVAVHALLKPEEQKVIEN